MSKPLNTLVRLTSLFVVLIAFFMSYYALRTAAKANEMAQEANQIAKDHLKEQVIIRYLYPFVDNNDLHKEPCKSPDGNGIWTIYYAPLFDITNTGSKAITLSDFSYIDHVETKDERIATDLYYDIFRKRYDFKKWFASRDFSPLSESIRRSLEDYDVIGMDIIINAGETKRFFLLGQIYVSLDPNLSLEELYQLSDGPVWETTITLMFADGLKKDVLIYVPRPYDGMTGTSGEYKSCPK